MQTSRSDDLFLRITALAALVHITEMVNGIARSGSCDSAAFDHMIKQIFISDHQSSDEMFCLPSSLDILKRRLQGEHDPHTKTLMLYVMNLLSLEKKLVKQHAMLKKIADRLPRIIKQNEFFGDQLHENTIAALAGLYGDTLSTLKPRIIVHGKPQYLNHAQNTNRVRALLFVGIQAAHFWRQHGGNSFRLVFERNKMLREIELLQEV